MYIRTVTTKGTKYVQLAHNYRDPETGVTKVKVLHNLGRADSLDLDALRRLVRSICRFLEPSEATQIQQQLDISPFEFLGSKDIGGAWFLDRVWRKLKINQTLKQLLSRRGYSTPVERLIFALVANRALAPSSKLAMEDWVGGEAMIADLPGVEVHQLYRAMDFLLEASEDIQRDVYFGVANLLNLDVDVIFFDTTTTYFETGDGAEDAESLRRRGYSKDSRPDLTQAVIGFAMTKDGIPVKCWVWPGNSPDQDLVTQVKLDLNGWRIGRVISVMDAGFNSPDNRRTLRGAGDHYIIGERMRMGNKGLLPAEALRRAGAYQKIKGGLEIKEVIVGGDSVTRRRFIVVLNLEEAVRDRKKREDIVAEAERRLDELNQLEAEPHTKAACALRSHTAYGRYLRQDKNGKLSLDTKKIHAEERFDGKFLISTSDDGLSSEDVVRAYKQLWQIERLHRDLKHVVDIRPVYHRLDQRIHSHVLLCWLSLLLIRVIENATDKSWFQVKNAMAGLKVGIHRTQAGEVWQTSVLSAEQKGLFEATKVDPPPRYPVIAGQGIRTL
jgi:hypothetical protein